jgi:hypothetical protein
MSRSAKTKDRQEGARSYPRYNWVRGVSATAIEEAGGAFARAGFADATLVLRWAEIAGPAVARLARPIKWQDDPAGATLTLKCEAGAAVLLQHQTRELIQRLNAYLGANRVGRLKFVSGQLAIPEEPPNHPTPTTEPEPETATLPDALARLERLRSRVKPPRPKRF